MKIYLLITILLVTGSACVQKDKLPDQVLPRDKMAEIMWNLIKADEFISSYILKDSTRNKKEESIRMYEKIFQIAGTSAEQFRKSMLFYQQRPDLLKIVMDSLRNYESKGMSEIAMPAVIPDSAKPLMKITPPASK